MNPEIGFLLVALVVMVYLFLTEKLPVDLTAFLGLVVFTLLGFVTPDEAFSGFSSPAVITMLSIFIVSASLLHTGLADQMGRRIYNLVGNREVPLLVMLMLLSGVLSAFMNNIAATAVLMPAVANISHRSRISPSRLFMPLSFGAILGGTTTLVGTPANILGAAILRERGLEPFGLFDFTPMGLALLAAGVLFMITFGRRLLPDREMGPVLNKSVNLTQVYQLHERLFTLRIPPDSSLAGVSLGQARLGTALGIQVVGILRHGKRRLAPDPETILKGRDVLLVEGHIADLQALMRVRDLEVSRTTAGQLPRPVKGVTGIRLRIPRDSFLVGQSLRKCRFRERFGAVVVGIRRGEITLRETLAEETLQKDDELLVLGARDQFQELGSQSGFLLREIGLSVLRSIQKNLFLIRVPGGSPMVGSTVRTSRIGELVGLTVGAIVRKGVTHLGVFPEAVIQEEDGLLVACEPARIAQLVQMGKVELETRNSETPLESEDVGLAEAALAPRSSLVGRTLGELNFRNRYGLQVLAVWREGRPIHSGLTDLSFRFGDALLLQGSWDRIHNLGLESDFVVLSQAVHQQRRGKKAPFALAGLLTFIIMVVSGYQPIHVASFTAASLVLLFRALTMEEAYRAIEWRAIFLVAAILPIGAAMERTGAALLLANTVTELAGPLGEKAVLASLVILSSLLSQCLDGGPAVVLLAPVAIETAAQLGFSPHTMMMAVTLAASAAFMTPFSHKANLLVMGAGGYRAVDYIRVGTPLTIVVVVLLVFLVPKFSPCFAFLGIIFTRGLSG